MTLLDLSPRTLGRLKVLGIVTAAIMAVSAIGSGIWSTWIMLGLPRPATVQYVDAVEQRLQHRADSTDALLRQLQINQLESHRAQVDRDIFDQRQRLKAVQDPDVEWRLHERERELQAIDVELQELRRKR
jgi:hypothetical protein